MLNKETVMLKVALIYSITKKLEKRENYSMDWPKKKEEKPVVPFGFSAAESNCEEGRNWHFYLSSFQFVDYFSA